MHRLRRLRLPVVALITLLVAPAFWGAARAQQATAPFTVMPASGREAVSIGEPVTFSVVAPEPGKAYVWVFGDGSLPVAGARVTHTFANIDDYTVKLSVQAPGSRVDAGSQLVRVAPEFRGVFASDIDGQFTPADLVQMAAVVRAPGLTTIGVRTAGALVAPRTAQFDITGGEDWLVMHDMRLADERDTIIRDELIKKPGATIPLDGSAFTLALDYKTKSGKQVTLSLAPQVKDFFQPDRPVAIAYPHIVDYVGLPPEGAGGDDYYLKGNPDFAHVDDWYVRKLALEFGRRGGAWPDDPNDVAMNIFRSIDASFGDGDPGDFNNDYNIARLFEDGSLSRTRKNGQYICISQAYLFGAIARTVGLPAREINNAIGKPLSQRADGVWRVSWWQEAGIQLWYNSDWHYFDTWLGFTDRNAYLNANLIVQSWNAYNRQNIEFKTVKGEPTGLKGQNWSAWPGDPPQWSFLEETVRDGIVVEGMIGAPEAAPITETEGAVALGGRPVAAGILGMPVLARPLDAMNIAGRP